MSGSCFWGCLVQLSYYCHLFRSSCWKDTHQRWWVRALSAPTGCHRPGQPVTISLQSLLHLCPLPPGVELPPHHHIPLCLSDTQCPLGVLAQKPPAALNWRHLLKPQRETMCPTGVVFSASPCQSVRTPKTRHPAREREKLGAVFF